MKIPQKFRGPAEYFVYAGPHDGGIHRMVSAGFSTLEEVEDWIFTSKKSYPDWDYQVWKSAGWEKVSP